MKKIVALFITVLYLAVSSGLAVEIHHCMGKVADISLSSSKSDNCSSCGMPKDSGSCCKDELKFVKLQDSYKLLTLNYELAVPETPLQYNTFVSNDLFSSGASFSTAAGHSPPRYPATSLCIINCVFRI